MPILAAGAPEAMALTRAIHQGDTDGLRALLATSPELAGTYVAGEAGTARSPLHLATDWPGHLPHVADTIRILVAAGADVEARFVGPHEERPLHWAASSDDTAAVAALLDAGADIEAPGAVIAGGTPLADAVAFSQWEAARLLVERGARLLLWQAAALGHLDLVREQAAGAEPAQITQALWTACQGGQRAVAEHLAGLGADLDWVGYDGLTPAGIARRNGDEDLVAWLDSLPR